MHVQIVKGTCRVVVFHFLNFVFVAVVVNDVVYLWAIVYLIEMVRKLDKFLCYMFLFAVLAPTMYKPQPFTKTSAANQKFRLIYSNSVLNQGQKILAWSRSS